MTCTDENERESETIKIPKNVKITTPNAEKMAAAMHAEKITNFSQKVYFHIPTMMSFAFSFETMTHRRTFLPIVEDPLSSLQKIIGTLETVLKLDCGHSKCLTIIIIMNVQIKLYIIFLKNNKIGPSKVDFFFCGRDQQNE